MFSTSLIFSNPSWTPIIRIFAIFMLSQSVLISFVRFSWFFFLCVFSNIISLCSLIVIFCLIHCLHFEGLVTVIWLHLWLSFQKNPSSLLAEPMDTFTVSALDGALSWRLFARGPHYWCFQFWSSSSDLFQICSCYVIQNELEEDFKSCIVFSYSRWETYGLWAVEGFWSHLVWACQGNHRWDSKLSKSIRG